MLARYSRFNTRGSPADVNGNDPPSEPFTLTGLPLAPR
jgi:hypothetical protein